MRFSRNSSPNVNAGSMADIAFLLLIFFLVTTTISTDVGINRKLSKLCEPNCPEPPINQRNLFQISINNNDEILVEDKLIALQDLKEIAKAFLDNNGDKSCAYCNGKQSSTSSDNPKEAIISLQTGKLTSYESFIGVQDELSKAYKDLRLIYTYEKFNKPFENLTKIEMKDVREAYPFLLSEALTR